MRVGVFCGSSPGDHPVFQQTASALGEQLARHGATLVYGGGNIGLMGIVADAVMEHGGKVVGVIPDFLLQREVGHRGITSLEVVGTMHERKQRMAELSDAFIALPGGWGTLDELAEILTWKQLGLVTQPVILLNCDHFFDALVQQMRTMVERSFLSANTFRHLEILETVDQVVLRLFSSSSPS